MEDGIEIKEDLGTQQREEIFSEAVRAGKRTYFFDVKATRRDDYYLTITESKKKFNRDGNSFYEKHKIFLYKEDFEKFVAGLSTAIEYIKENNPQGDAVEYKASDSDTKMTEEFTNVEFEDLGEKSE